MHWRVFAPAKINRFLWVGPLEPTGYHALGTLFQTVGLGDVLDIRCLQSDGPFQVRWVIEPDMGLDSEDTTLARAVRRLTEGDGFTPPGVWEVRLRKQIPVAAGLGGGSSDAAVLLMALNEIWGLGLGLSDLHQHARAVGMDAPFFLYGGRALADGYGDRVWPLPDAGREWFVLFVPPVRAVTAAMYRRLDESRTPPDERPDITPLLETPSRLEAVLEEARNDFAPVIEATWPEGKAWKDRLHRMGARPVQWSGSGPALWGRFERADAAWRAVRFLEPDLPAGASLYAVPALDRRAWSHYVRPRRIGQA